MPPNPKGKNKIKPRKKVKKNKKYYEFSQLKKL